MSNVTRCPTPGLRGRRRALATFGPRHVAPATRCDALAAGYDAAGRAVTPDGDTVHPWSIVAGPTARIHLGVPATLRYYSDKSAQWLSWM